MSEFTGWKLCSCNPRPGLFCLFDFWDFLQTTLQSLLENVSPIHVLPKHFRVFICLPIESQDFTSHSDHSLHSLNLPNSVFDNAQGINSTLSFMLIPVRFRCRYLVTELQSLHALQSLCRPQFSLVSLALPTQFWPWQTRCRDWLVSTVMQNAARVPIWKKCVT